jgi:uncharacterized protein
MINLTLPVIEPSLTEDRCSEDALAELAKALARRIARDSRPRLPQVHLVEGGSVHQLLVANGTRLYNLTDETAHEFQAIIESRDQAALEKTLVEFGLDAPPAIDDQPLESPPVQALSLAVAQKCNLGCSYCYAQQGAFGGQARNMSLDTARRAVDLLLEGCASGGKVNLAFLGGEPLVNRSVLKAVTEYATVQAATRSIVLHCSITTNGTLLTEDDADFFEEHAFAITVSLDGPRQQHDLLRPFKNGAGSFDRIIARIQPLLKRQRRMQVSARVTITPDNLNLAETLERFVDMGFHSVGFSPLLRSSSARNELDEQHLELMLQGMIECGLTFERRVLRGDRYPFLNMVNALRELHRGTHRPYPCGAGAGYFGVSATGDLAACHRFVDDREGAMGSLETGIDRRRQNDWLASRHVHFQEPCSGCWARYLCGGGCHHEVLARGRSACDFIRGWLHYTLQAFGRLSLLAPNYFNRAGSSPSEKDKRAVVL